MAIDDLESIIVSSMEECINENTTTLEDQVKGAGDRAVALLKKRSAPKSRKRSGPYRRGWRADVNTDETGTECTVHNRMYQLTHLLEKGHRIKNQTGRDFGEVSGDHVIEEVYNEVAEKLSNVKDGT